MVGYSLKISSWGVEANDGKDGSLDQLTCQWILLQDHHDTSSLCFTLVRPLNLFFWAHSCLWKLVWLSIIVKFWPYPSFYFLFYFSINIKVFNAKVMLTCIYALYSASHSLKCTRSFSNYSADQNNVILFLFTSWAQDSCHSSRHQLHIQNKKKKWELVIWSLSISFIRNSKTFLKVPHQ